MIIDPYKTLKIDTYSTKANIIISQWAPDDLPYRLIIWGRSISHHDALSRITRYGVTGMNYRIWSNPTTGAPTTVNVIETDDPQAERTIARELFSTLYRVKTPMETIADEAELRSIFPWRLMCRDRPPVEDDFRHIVDREDRLIAHHTGYQRDSHRWAPDLHVLGTIYAIYVRDFETAILMKTAIAYCDLEGPSVSI